MVLKNAPKNVMVLRNAMLQPHPEKRYGAQKRARPHTHTHTHMLTHTHTHTHTCQQVYVGIGVDNVWDHAKPSKHLEASGSVWERKVAAGSFWNHFGNFVCETAETLEFARQALQLVPDGSRNTQLLPFAPRRWQKLPNA
jgi:hypothetical protein